MRQVQNAGMLRRAARALGLGWARLGLLTQSLLLVALMLFAMQLAAAEAERRFARDYLIGTAMQMEQAILRALLLQFVADLSPGEAPSASRIAAIDAALMRHIADGYFDMVKLWSTDGQLLYWSHGPVAAGHAADGDVARSIWGETVVTIVEGTEASTTGHLPHEAGVYEIYIPLANAQGETVAVGEIYCSFDVLVDRVREQARSLVRGSILALVVGLAALCALIGLAQAKLFQSEQSLSRSMTRVRDLTRRNRALNGEVHRLRREGSTKGDQVVSRIRAELRDGPMQLLSLAALYVSQIVGRQSCRHQVNQARELTSEALESLRWLTTESTPEDATEIDICDVAQCVVAVFEKETGRRVTTDWSGAAGTVTRAAPEIVAAVLPPLLRACGQICPEGHFAVSAVCRRGRMHFIVDCIPPSDGSSACLPITGQEEFRRLEAMAATAGCSLSWSENAGAVRVVADFACDDVT